MNLNCREREKRQREKWRDRKREREKREQERDGESEKREMERQERDGERDVSPSVTARKAKIHSFCERSLAAKWWEAQITNSEQRHVIMNGAQSTLPARKNHSCRHSAPAVFSEH